MITGHSYIFFYELPAYVFCLFLFWVVCIFYYLSILNANPFSVTCYKYLWWVCSLSFHFIYGIFDENNSNFSVKFIRYFPLLFAYFEPCTINLSVSQSHKEFYWSDFKNF